MGSLSNALGRMRAQIRRTKIVANIKLPYTMAISAHLARVCVSRMCPSIFLCIMIIAFRLNSQSEDDGYLICYGFHAMELRSELLVFDALRVEVGPTARLGIPVPLPHGLHGCFSPQYYGPDSSV